VNKYGFTRSAVSSNGWADFFGQYREFDEKRNGQKLRGINDYSLLTAVLKANDEVRLHTRFIFSLIDPAGKHYQGPLFLVCFLKTIGLDPDWLDLRAVRVYKEYDPLGQGQIDLYLTDGSRHIIIENKLNANDQADQVRRYVEMIGSSSGAAPDDILFLYLTKGRESPTSKALAGYEIKKQNKDTCLVDTFRSGKTAARYLNAHYDPHILAWIDACLDEAGNLSNLRHALVEYRQVVERVTRVYKSKVMNFDNFIEGATPEEAISRYAHAVEISRQLPRLHAKWLSGAMGDGIESLVRPYVETGRLHTLGECEPFRSLQFEPQHATAYFNGERGGKDKGVFWQVNAGPHAGTLALAILYGAKLLHVGLVPIKKMPNTQITMDVDKSSEVLRMLQEAARNSPAVDANVSAFQFKQYGGINKIVPGLVSSAMPINDEMLELKNFQESRIAILVPFLLQVAGLTNVVSE